MRLLKMGKDVNITILIWHMLDEMVKKSVRTRFYASCNYYCNLYLLVKILLVKLKNCLSSACWNLIYGAPKQSTKMWRVQRWWDFSKLVINTLTNYIVVTCLALSEYFLSFLFFFFLWWWQEPRGEFYMGGISKNDYIQFFWLANSFYNNLNTINVNKQVW